MPVPDRNFHEHRAHTRYPVSLPAIVARPDGSSPAAATVVDISLGGALACAAFAACPGDTVLLDLRLPPQVVHLLARVVAVSADGSAQRLHLAFAGGDRASLSALAALVERHAARAGSPHDRARQAAIASPRTFRL